MARTDWVAIATEPAAEYLAHSELTRFGLCPYLPQARRRFIPCSGKVVIRYYPLFPRYVLLQYRHLNRELLRLCRGVRKQLPVLCDREGNVWRAPDQAVQVVKDAEARGEFEEEFRKGTKVRLNMPILKEFHAVVEKSDGRLVTLFSPLFGGSKLMIARSGIACDT